MKATLALFALLLLCLPPSFARAENNCFDRLDERKANELKDRQEEAKAQGKPIPTATPSDAPLKCPEVPKDAKPPTCSECPSGEAVGSACKYVDDNAQDQKLNELYKMQWIREEAAGYADDNHTSGIAMLQCLVAEEFGAWLKDAFESACPGGPSGGDLVPTAQAWVDPDDCSLHCKDEVEKTHCKPFADAILAHEKNHQVWCKAGKGDAGRTCIDEFRGSYKAQGHGDLAKFKQCNRQVVNAVADDEATAYDVGGATLRAGLAELRHKCGNSTSNDDLILLNKDTDEVFLHEAYQILRVQGWKP